MPNVITPEEYEEMRRLIDEFHKVQLHGADVLRKFGMESAEFLEADRKSGALWRRIREIQGMADKPWNA